MAISDSDFAKIWASTSPLTPYSFSESNYKEGWNFIGSAPPARQMWDFLQKNTDEKAKYLLDKFGSYLPLAGGTLTGSVTQTMGDPSIREAYIIKYTNITDNAPPAANKAGYVVQCVDSNGTNTGGLYKNYQSNGWTSTRLADNKNNDLAAVQVEHGTSNALIFRPTTDNLMKLGTSSYRWEQLFAGTATIDTSDERLKDNISAIPDDVLDAWAEVNWVQYQFKDAIAKKGENARIHCGAIAQRIKSVFESHNLDAFRYGLLCYDEWDADDEQPAGNRYSLRYEEALCMEAAYQRRRADRLEARIEALEKRGA